MAYDRYVTEFSDNENSTYGVMDAEAREELSDVKSALTSITGNDRIPYSVENGYYPTSTVGDTVTTPTDSDNFQAAMISCTSGDQFTINAKSGALGRAWAFLDADHKVKRRETINGVIANKVITAEAGEVYLVINNKKADNPGADSYIGDLLVKRVDTLETESAKKTTVDELKTAFYDLQIDNLPIMLLKDKYVTTAAVIADYTGWDCTDYIPVKGYKSLKVKSSVQSGYNVFVDESKEKVGNNFNVTTNYTTVNVPSNAEYVLMSNTSAGMANLEAFLIRYPVMSGKHPNTETAFSQLVDMGVYNIEKAKLSSFADKPSDADDAVATLINYSGAYAGGAYTIQRLYQLSGKSWERLIYSQTGEVSAAWRRIDADAHIDNSNVLKGKKIVTAGDSYTQAYWDGDYAEYNGKNYGYYIAQRNGMTFVNSGISGSTMAVPPGGAGNKNPFVIDRYAAVPADTDYLTIWFGINDAANCDLGSITDGDDGTPVNNTIYGAWNIVLKYYLTNRPWMKVLIIVPSMPNSESANNVRDAIRAVAKKWGYPYLDWQMDYSIPAFFDKREGMSNEAVSLRRTAFGYNGPNEGHPNPQWYEYESTIIEAKLRSI